MKDLSFGANELMTASLVSFRTLVPWFLTTKPKRSSSPDGKGVGDPDAVAGGLVVVPVVVATGLALGVSDGVLTGSRARRARPAMTALTTRTTINDAYATGRFIYEASHASIRHSPREGCVTTYPQTLRRR